MTENRIGTGRTLALLAIFLLSGATSLVYQILWIRVLSLTLGSTVYAISIVISAFMAGLALGSAWFGRLGDRFAQPLRAYALMEIGIGAAALVLPFVFRAIASAAATGESGLGPAFSSGLFGFVASFVMLLVPTTLMGGTLPVLSRYLTGFSLARGASIGGLYAANTIGAIVGTAVTGFVLIRALGIERATWAAAGGNLVVFALAWALSARWGTPSPASAARGEGDARRAGDVGDADDAGDSAGLLGAITFVYAVNGFVGLGLELLWTRAIVLFSTSTIYAFTVILTTYLVGLAVGSAVMSGLVSRIRRPAWLLAVFQLLIGVIAALTPIGLGLVGTSFVDAMTPEAESRWLVGMLGRAYAVSAIFMLPATLLMGASFPLVARVVAGHTSTVARAVGRVYALNTIGAVAGSLLAAFVVLPAIGIQGAIVAFGLVSVLSGSYLVMRTGARATSAVAGLATIVVIAILAGSPNYFHRLLERVLDATFTYYEEGVETTVAVYDSERAQRPVLAINNTVLDDRGVVHKLLVHVPMMLMDRSVERALVLGFGVGISNQSLSAYGVPVNHCVEISPAVMNAAPYFASLNGDIADRGDPSFEVFIEDGRRLLLGAGEPYDLIVLDANSGNLRNAGVGKLYTRDFFEICRDRVSEGGMVTLYVSPNGTLDEFDMITHTFQEVFPHTSLWVDRVYGQTCVLVGAQRPLRIDLDRVVERLCDPDVTADLAVFSLDQPGALLSCFVGSSEVLALATADGVVNSDDHPVMEFFPLRVDRFAADDRLVTDRTFMLLQESIDPYLTYEDATEPGVAEILTFLERAERTYPSIADAWVHRWNANADFQQSSLTAAAALHPQCEYLRSSLGYGRAAYERVRAAADSSGTPERLGRAGIIAVRRGASADAYGYLTRAMSAAAPAADDEAQLRLSQYALGAGRAARELGRWSEARRLLTLSDSLGVDATTDLLEMEVAEAGGDSLAPTPLITELAQASLTRLNVVRALDLLLELRRRRQLEPGMALVAARGLEAVGDMPGAYQQYRVAAAASGDAPEVMLGLERAATEIAIRASFLRAAIGADPRVREAFASTTTGAVLPPGEIAPLDHDSYQIWLRLADLYLRGGRPIEAYRAARAARWLAPDRPEPYLAIGFMATIMGSDEIGDVAYEMAVELGSDPSQVEGARAQARSRRQ